MTAKRVISKEDEAVVRKTESDYEEFDKDEVERIQKARGGKK